MVKISGAKMRPDEQKRDTGTWTDEMFDKFTTRRSSLGAIMIVVALVTASACRAQEVVITVHGEPITELDVEQRTKFIELETSKTPSRQQVIDELRSEKLKVREARKLGWNSDYEVDEAYGSMAGRLGRTPEQLTQIFAKNGTNVDTVKHRIRAALADQYTRRPRGQPKPWLDDTLRLRPRTN